MRQETETTKQTVSLPLMCPEGHQIYIMYFPQLERYGFGCGVCHIFGTAITHARLVLQIDDVRALHVHTREMREEIMLGMGTKAIHQCCPKGHFLMAYEFTDGFGFGCIHCKVYSITFGDKDKTLDIRVTRELEQNDPGVKPLQGPIKDHPAFTIH